MLVSYQWIKEFVSMELSPEEIAQKLTRVGLEVKGIYSCFKPIPKCVVGEIKHIIKHPNADKLNITQVHVGEVILDIVCGASNIRVGMKVPVALVGCILGKDFKIKKTKIRGVESFGMICSQAELGLAKHSDGIWELSTDAKVGEEISKHFPLEDKVLDIDITSNRSDCLSIIGIAREVSVILKKHFEKKETLVNNNDTQHINISIENNDACQRYIGQVIRDVKVCQPPDWLAFRLEQHGFRSINNVVDITNYILLETGQPLHAFDLNKVSSQEIKIRYAKTGEKILLLNGVELTLTENDLVIADSEKPIALAGIMGGEYSSVTESSTDILIECASFNPEVIKQTVKRHKIASDSSYRFERGVDIDRTTNATKRAIELCLEMKIGKIGSMRDLYRIKNKMDTIYFAYEEIESTLGIKINKDIVNSILQYLGFKLKQISYKRINVEVPTWRKDINHSWDIIEEIARIYGYDNIPETIPSIANNQMTYQIKDVHSPKIQNIIQGFGYNQTYNFSFISEDFVNQQNELSKKDVSIHLVNITNPINKDYSYLRENQLMGLLQTLKTNIEKNTIRYYKFYEMGRVFSKNKQSTHLYKERNAIGLLLSGEVDDRNWIHSSKMSTIYDIQGHIETIFQHYNIEVKWDTSDIDIAFYNDIRAKILSTYEGNSICLGYLGEINPDLLEKMNISTKSAVYFAHIDYDKLLSIYNPLKEIAPLSKFPSVYRDFAIVTDLKTDLQSVMNSIKGFDPHICNVKLTDIYSGGKDNYIQSGQLSVLFEIEYQNFHKTLEKKEVEKIENKLASHITATFEVSLR